MRYWSSSNCSINAKSIEKSCRTYKINVVKKEYKPPFSQKTLGLLTRKVRMCPFRRAGAANHKTTLSQKEIYIPLFNCVDYVFKHRSSLVLYTPSLGKEGGHIIIL